MWKPPERVKHPIPEARWPSRDEAAASLLFSPLRVGAVELEQRTWVPAMVPWRATDDGHVTDDLLAWYERFARGRPGALVVEATGIRDVPSGPLLRVGHDRFVAGLAELVRTVRRASGGHTRLFLQVIDFLTIRRRPEPETFFRRYLKLEDRHRAAFPGLADEEVRERLLALPEEALAELLTDREMEALLYGYRERVTDLDLPHVAELPRALPDLFAGAAARAQQAGFDGVELHYAHAYTMASFLSALNQRHDGYGGPRENRIRLPLEVYRAVRERVGTGFVVGCRYLSEDCLPHGNTVDDAIYFGVELARAGMDYLSLSRGGKFEDAKQPKVGRAAYPYTGPSGYECMPTAISDERGPFGRNVPAVARIRAAVREAGCATPIVVAGGICTYKQAEALLGAGEADVVAAARQSLADPDWYRKIQLGLGEQVRRCTYTNYCEGLDQMHKQVTCKLWDREALDEPGVKMAREENRRLLPPAWEPAAALDDTAAEIGASAGAFRMAGRE
ncbi:MAG TPA: NADH:flavin oxidoreductase [Thermoanaerobaculia bacterium]|jgi:2,4-dienoyl-CoA reductase-like NADH-dependent reductase (Old Yellow Enzyme family)|nr:NADH:flavin oxidoreductase [Thermoanaerobaculia bacterium]